MCFSMHTIRQSVPLRVSPSAFKVDVAASDLAVPPMRGLPLVPIGVNLWLWLAES